ncbi:uncharacterized protein LOC111879081 [Lactuca sativa]|uniref:uncharacterized protein LOC111879081 n=1 Tax=Lactuca sativa TaxID=4236 RepID=UPI000CD8BC97|nr:uncharacterized protein LOC111879081 [Lactuca sativa]
MFVEEHVARFLHIIGNDMRNTMVSFMYGHAKSITSRCFHRVLRAVVALESYYIQQPKGDVVSKEIQEKNRFYPYFKNCVGAIDGTHVHLTYVLTGWEGTASDSRIMKDALKRDDKLLIPKGRYYLVDACLPHTLELMTSYRERAFGVLKRRFPIVRSTLEPFYSCDTQSDIFVACCILQNFLLAEDRDKKLEYEVLQEVLDEQPQQVRHDVNNERVYSNEAEELRNAITTQIWDDYSLKPNNEMDMSN